DAGPGATGPALHPWHGARDAGAAARPALPRGGPPADPRRPARVTRAVRLAGWRRLAHAVVVVAQSVARRAPAERDLGTGTRTGPAAAPLGPLGSRAAPAIAGVLEPAAALGVARLRGPAPLVLCAPDFRLAQLQRPVAHLLRAVVGRLRGRVAQLL